MFRAWEGLAADARARGVEMSGSTRTAPPALGALQRNTTSRVIFSDTSQDLLDHARSLAREAQVAHRCEFVCASADDLSVVLDASVDAVTTRSVLIHVGNKQQAINEGHRVLTTDGRLSVFEPINRFGEPQPAHMFWGFDVTPAVEIAAKVKAVYRRIQPLDADRALSSFWRDSPGRQGRQPATSLRFAVTLRIESGRSAAW